MKIVFIPILLSALAGGLASPGLVKAASNEPAAAQSATPAAIDWEKAKQLYQRSQVGEKLTPEEQTYLDRAKQEHGRQQSGNAPGAAPQTSTAGPAIDWDKARQLHQRSQAGEKLTPDEQAYLDRAKQEMGRQQGQGGKSPANNAPPPRETTGYPPLTDLSAEGRYKEQDGGLYGKGKNSPPDTQMTLALKAAAAIQPRNEEGKPSPDGKIGLIAVGMSNTTQEFQAFMALLRKTPGISPHLVVVDGAQGGQEGRAWSTSAMQQDKGPFETLAQRIKAAGLTPAQVQVAWVKLALAGPAQYGEFPAHAKTLQQFWTTTIVHLKTLYPNLALAYQSSRIYAGYASTGLNPEPYAYEEAYSVRWMIQDQMSGNPALNADPCKGAVKAPVLLWGPYLWADGTAGRKDNRIKWLREDLGGDGTHPGPAGQAKVAGLLLDFLKTDPSSKPWFTAPATR